MKIPFYILGLLIRYGPQHGYRIKQIIEEDISDFAKIKLPAIYYHLAKLNENGYIKDSTDKDGNRPEKTIYTITESGRKYFAKLVGEIADKSYSPEFDLDGLLFFYDMIDGNLLKSKLHERKDEALKLLRLVERHEKQSIELIPEKSKLYAKAIFGHHSCHLKAELKWIEGVLEGLN